MQRMITYIFINENIEEFKLKTMNFEINTWMRDKSLKEQLMQKKYEDAKETDKPLEERTG